jgi:hypothetical protein
MDLQEFEQILKMALSALSYITEISIVQRTEVSLSGKIGLKKQDYELHLFYNQQVYALQFALIYEKQRIWGLDKDSRIGWHIHPLNNVNVHQEIPQKNIAEIIAIFDAVYEML